MNSEIALKRLSDLHTRFGIGPIEVGTPASDGIIESIQLRLGVSFHLDYIEFLKTFGALRINDITFYGTWSENPFDERGGTVLGETLELRQEYSLPNDIIPVYGGHYLSFLCMNCSPISTAHKLVFYDTDEMAVFACEHSDSFEKYLLNYLKGSIRALENSKRQQKSN